MSSTGTSTSRPTHELSLVPYPSNHGIWNFPLWLLLNILSALRRLNFSFSPAVTFKRLSQHRFTIKNSYQNAIMAAAAVSSLYFMKARLFIKLAIPSLYAVALILPITSQFFLPATPILAWLITFFTSKFIPTSIRPTIHVTLLPTLESILYGANISDILTRFTHPVLDIIAWLPYGIAHFVIPFVVAAVAFVFGPRGSIDFFAKGFGWNSLIGVVIQVILPCAPPWYELTHGLTPAAYSMKGSAGGLMRIDRIFGGSGYTETFTNAPIAFGAFPSLHSGCATFEALFLSHFFPRFRIFYWAYAGTLYWSTMYLTHHYLIDVVAGGSLAVMCFYGFMPLELRNYPNPPTAASSSEAYALLPQNSHTITNEHGEEVDLDDEIRKLEEGDAEVTA